jgi:hypothetical protein
VAIPALLATSAVHHHLVTKGLRTRVGLVVETGAARETHHFAVLAGYGAEAVHPYLALETLQQLAGGDAEKGDKAIKHFIKGVGKGLLKVMSKMGISTYMSYTGAQIFEAVGLQKKMSLTSISPAPRRKSRGSASSRSWKRRFACTGRPSATTRCWRRCSTPAANTPIACAAKSTCGRRM